MHRHGYKGRKFGRETDQRRALIKGLADALIIHQSIETTLDKAKELIPYTEKLITKAKKGDVHSRRLIISKLQTLESAHKLVDDIAPKLSGRDSGHLTLTRTRVRRGDSVQLAKVSFVDDLSVTVPKVQAKKPVADSPAKKAESKPKTAKAKGAKSK